MDDGGTDRLLSVLQYLQYAGNDIMNSIKNEEKS
jgi:hypothetical protein